ncbi:hypothetical protein [Solibacillus sp. FSL K6-1523]|uniref:hypothetical protein n=1 Tax=Solibacillus sp. FSL K6-1523 TaxID=2921471 RepID=UPI0030F57FEC
MSGRKKGVLIVLACATLLGLLYYFIFSSSAILKNVSHTRGYNVQVSENTIPVEMFIEPEMYEVEMEIEKIMNEVVYDQHHTKIILERVYLDEEELSFSFTTDYDLSVLEGEFLYNGIFHSDGSIMFTSRHNEYEATTLNNVTLQIGSTGSGPNSDFRLSLRQPPMELLKEGFTVRYNAMYLHKYQLKWR